MFLKKAVKKTAPAPNPYTVHVDKAKEPIARAATPREAYEAIEEFMQNQQVAHHYTLVNNRKMQVVRAWTA